MTSAGTVCLTRNRSMRVRTSIYEAATSPCPSHINLSFYLLEAQPLNSTRRKPVSIQDRNPRSSSKLQSSESVTGTAMTSGHVHGISLTPECRPLKADHSPHSMIRYRQVSVSASAPATAPPLNEHELFCSRPCFWSLLLFKLTIECTLSSHQRCPRLNSSL
jgi:hypothetical protein